MNSADVIDIIHLIMLAIGFSYLAFQVAKLNHAVHELRSSVIALTAKLVQYKQETDNLYRARQSTSRSVIQHAPLVTPDPPATGEGPSRGSRSGLKFVKKGGEPPRGDSN